MALLRLNLDVLSKKLVFSERNPRLFTLPDLHQEDGLTIEFRALSRINEINPPFFERITLSSYDLLMSIGTAGSILASASSWTASDSGTLLTGTLDLSTAGIDALTDGTSRTFEIRLFDGTNFYRAQTTCVIRKSVATSGTLQPVVNDTALGQREASRTYVKKEGAAGEGFVLTSENGSQAIVYLHNDLSLRVEPLT